MTLTPQFLDELRHRTMLSALIGRTTKLQKAGREFRACCPFHNEKSPSFYVNDDKGFYHCFGCGAHGDAIRWMTDNRGLPFIDAVKELVQAAGMEMPAQDRASTERAERAKGLHEAMADAAAWFTDQLGGIAGAEARSALEKRGIKAETARTFGLGFAPDSRGKLKEALKSYGDPMLVEAGLLIAVEEKTPYDRFRGRLMIPIRDPRGRPIAFGGRIIGDGEPKYLNSPETPLFDKGRTLYNLDRALPAARQTGRIIVVEGYMDVIALAQAGFGEAVAPLGTALTEHQLDRLWRIADVPILCFDGDLAGQKAAMRAATRAMPMLSPGRSLQIARLPQGQDPDDVVQNGGPDAFTAILDGSQPLHEYIWREELSILGDDPSPDERAAFHERLIAHSKLIMHEGLREQYLTTYKDRFFALFGPKSNRFTVVGKAIAKASRDIRSDLEYLFQRAVLLGLMRHTSVLRSEYELVMQLPLISRGLREWRDQLVDLGMYREDLDEDSLNEALSKANLPSITKRDLAKDLAFTFYSAAAEPEVAERDLKAVMEVLVEEWETRRAVTAAEVAYKAEFCEQTAIGFQRAKLHAVDARHRLMEWLTQLRDAA